MGSGLAGGRLPSGLEGEAVTLIGPEASPAIIPIAPPGLAWFRFPIVPAPALVAVKFAIPHERANALRGRLEFWVLASPRAGGRSGAMKSTGAATSWQRTIHADSFEIIERERRREPNRWPRFGPSDCTDCLKVIHGAFADNMSRALI